MKIFIQLILAAVLGSAVTLGVFYYGDQENNVVIEHVLPLKKLSVAYDQATQAGVVAPVDFTVAADRVTPAVVHVRVKSSPIGGENSNESYNSFHRFFFDQIPKKQHPIESAGSGVIISEEGYIVTNHHVVRNAEMVEVTFSDNTSLKAEVIGTDADTDIALIKVDPSNKTLAHLSFVDSDEAKVGQWVLAVGSPFNLKSTVTAGIISAKGRNINIINSSSLKVNDKTINTAIESFIQTDAAINPGNSGGALVNLEGNLLGINTAIATTTGSYTGYGFAIPSNLVSKVVEDLIAYGVVQRGWLGVTIQNVTSELANQEGLGRKTGVFVIDFAENSAAAEAGIKKGDVIIKLDAIEILSNTSLIAYIGRKRPGEKVRVKIDRKGKEVEVSVLLKNREGKTGAVKRKKEEKSYTKLGLVLKELESARLKKTKIEGGVLVEELEYGKVTQYTNMKAGFIITHVDDKSIESIKDIKDILKKKKGGDLITFSGVYEGFPREYIYALRM